jgi:hypothetical protein
MLLMRERRASTRGNHTERNCKREKPLPLQRDAYRYVQPRHGVCSLFHPILKFRREIDARTIRGVIQVAETGSSD